MTDLNRPNQLSLSREDLQRKSIEELNEGTSPFQTKKISYRTQSNPIAKMKNRLNSPEAFMRTTSLLSSTKSNISASTITNVEDFKNKQKMQNMDFRARMKAELAKK